MILKENFQDEVSENTLKKRRQYYLKHGIKTSGLLESSELNINTPYMLRNDGELLNCGDYHPYIKSHKDETLEETKEYLFLHNDFLEWFYNNTLNEEVKELISSLNYTQDEIDKLWYLTNQEFCRVRTSNYRYKTGGDNGQIYFRISSEGFDWFELIWETCVKFINSIDYITIMKDPQTFGKQFDYIELKGEIMNKYPIKDFISIEGEPLIETMNEDIEKHDTLNSLLFNEEDELRPEIKEAIKRIVDQFVTDLKENEVNIKVKDIVLIGSNVSYNYTKDSDLDIHIIVDSKSLDCNPEIYTLLYSAYRSIFNNNYDITIKGIPVEIYVELDTSEANSNGKYSLNKGWLKHPIQQAIPDINMDDFEKEFKVWEDKYFDLLDNLDDKDILKEGNSKEEETLIVYNATNETDYSHFDKSKEIGIHCGTLKATQCIFNNKHYKFLNKLILNNYKIIEASRDYKETWSVMELIVHHDNVLTPFSEEEINKLKDKCIHLDYPDKNEKRSKLLRDALLNKGYNLIKYKNEVEDPDSISYIILDNSIIKNIEIIEEKK